MIGTHHHRIFAKCNDKDFMMVLKVPAKTTTTIVVPTLTTAMSTVIRMSRQVFSRITAKAFVAATKQPGTI